MRHKWLDSKVAKLIRPPKVEDIATSHSMTEEVRALLDACERIQIIRKED